MNIAIIPARGGSKRIPRKNIKLFNGKPIIAYSIEAAINSGCFERVIVSTDDKDIAEVAKKYGAEVPFIRPKNIADDHATTLAVVTHALNWLKEHGQNPTYTCLMYATAPFIQPEILRESLNLLSHHDKKFCFSVTEYPFPIQRALKISASGDISMFNEEHLNTRSQDLEPAYHDAGQFYWGLTESFLDGSVVFSSCSVPYVLPSYQVQDIDTEDDWIKAELLCQLIQRKV
jgi:pseudaminic acid cytidylyltransferase